MKKFLINLIISGLLIGIGTSVTLFEFSELTYDVKYLNSENSNIKNEKYNFLLKTDGDIYINTQLDESNIIKVIDNKLTSNQVEFMLEYDNKTFDAYIHDMANNHIYDMIYPNTYNTYVNLNNEAIYNSIRIIMNDIKSGNLYSYKPDISRAKLYIYTSSDNTRDIIVNNYI